jgi:ATP-dependent protease ClpP protease subunit
MADASRDLWLSADEAKDYGIIDEVIYMDLSEYE